MTLWIGQELTGDTDYISFDYIKKCDIMYAIVSSKMLVDKYTNLFIRVTTPEKWDSMTRRWTDHRKLMSDMRLCMVMYPLNPIS